MNIPERLKFFFSFLLSVDRKKKKRNSFLFLFFLLSSFSSFPCPCSFVLQLPGSLCALSSAGCFVLPEVFSVLLWPQAAFSQPHLQPQQDLRKSQQPITQVLNGNEVMQNQKEKLQEMKEKTKENLLEVKENPKGRVQDQAVVTV